ncbi:ISPpu14, transposase Orf2 [Pseudomonas poae RE*1-1-14]|uniref:transposase n=1 Tax=Pseudomonas poae TaxID=200451 RepID=UPI0002AF50C5|nr:transposase [Pseudomonas poae]AGE24469.1 ISPpu14, transposase Orf2 [Pseudomonas poae RE*1-1-14]
MVIISLPLGDKSITVKWPTSEPDGCARFIRLGPKIRVDAIWLATEPMDTRADTKTTFARLVAAFGAAKPHCAHFSKQPRYTNRMKVLVHDGVGIWLARGA